MQSSSALIHMAAAGVARSMTRPMISRSDPDFLPLDA